MDTRRRPRRGWLLTVTSLVAAVSCASATHHAQPQAPTARVGLEMVAEGCVSQGISLYAGLTRFKVTVPSTAPGGEFTILDGSTVLERVTVPPGATRALSVRLRAGSYAVRCGTAAQPVRLLVTPVQSGSGSGSGSNTHNAYGQAGTTSQNEARDIGIVETYIATEFVTARSLVSQAMSLAAAVHAGDLPTAQAIYPAARGAYEALRFLVVKHSSLDRAIDARSGDSSTAWGGFPRIAHDLWLDHSVIDLGPIADRLVTDLERVRDLLPTLRLTPSEITAGASELIATASAAVDGSGEPDSGSDLADIAAEVDGAHNALHATESLLPAARHDLTDELGRRFSAVTDWLHQYLLPNGMYLAYGSLSQDHSALVTLNALLNALADPASQVAALVIQ